MELVRNYAYAPQQALLTFYRDDKAREIDVLIEENSSVTGTPVAAKKRLLNDI